MLHYIQSFVHDQIATVSNKVNTSFFSFSSNSEASASELLENLEEMLPQYYNESDVIISFKYSTTFLCVTRCERANITIINSSIARVILFFC